MYLICYVDSIPVPNSEFCKSVIICYYKPAWFDDRLVKTLSNIFFHVAAKLMVHTLNQVVILISTRGACLK